MGREAPPPSGRPWDVLAIGETMAAVTPASALPLARAEEFRLVPAGAETNVLLYLAEAGFATSWASRVGEDPLGDRLIRTITRHGVDTTLVARDPAAPTGAMFKDPGSGVHYLRAGSAASRMSPDWLGAVDLSATRILHLSGITPALSDACAAMIPVAIERARRAGTLVSFDVNFRARLWEGRSADELLDLARSADVVFVGRDEAASVWGAETAEQIAEYVGSGPTMVVKDGPVGAYQLDGSGCHFVGAPSVDVVEETGAGDAFAAGYLAALLRGRPAEERLEWGHGLAARALMGTEDFVPAEGTDEGLPK